MFDIEKELEIKTQYAIELGKKKLETTDALRVKEINIELDKTIEDIIELEEKAEDVL